jgi:acetyl esterase/lipase
MKRWRWLGIPLLVLAVAVGWGGSAKGQEAKSPTRIEDVIYGRLPGVALTMDVFKPEKPSGIGVLFMVSGGWFSSHEAVNVAFAKPFTDRGHTVFEIVHGSQPKYTIQEIWPQIDRAVRFVRYHAAEYGVDPNRLGISGASAGGHLSLMQGARGHDGDPNAKDPVDRVSSKVQAVACFFPPTDFLNYGKSGQNALAYQELNRFHPAFGPKADDPAAIGDVARETSPITYLTKAMPPALIIHGDADTLVPIQQAQVFLAKMEELGIPNKLVTKKGAAHGWARLVEDDVPVLADWMEQHLKK